MSRRAEKPVKLLRLVNAHLSFVVARTSATCIVCHELKDRGEPSCERCGLGAFHFACYTDAIARSPKERVFWAATSDEEAEPLTRFAIFLCPGVPVMSPGPLVPPGPGLLAARNRTLAEYVPVFLKWLSFVRQRRENTVRSYGEDLKTFLGFCETAGLSKPDDVTFRHLEFYLGWLQKERSLKATSANRHLHALRTFWFWMVREEITTRNPAAQVFLLAAPKTLPSYLSIAEQEQVLATLATRTDRLGRRDYALVATALFTGLRCSELAHLQLAHLDLDAGVLRVVNGKGQKDRELPVIPRLEAILRRYLKEVGPPLVNRPVGQIIEGEAVVLHGRARTRRRTVAVRRGSRYRSLGRTPPSPEEVARLRAAMIPPAPPYVFVNADPQQSYRARRAGQPLGSRSVLWIVRKSVSAIVGRSVFTHMLRHSFASRLRENGADLQDIQEALGHSAITTTTMYAHISTRRRREKLAEYLK